FSTCDSVPVFAVFASPTGPLVANGERNLPREFRPTLISAHALQDRVPRSKTQVCRQPQQRVGSVPRSLSPCLQLRACSCRESRLRDSPQDALPFQSCLCTPSILH